MKKNEPLPQQLPLPVDPYSRDLAGTMAAKPTMHRPELPVPLRDRRADRAARQDAPEDWFIGTTNPEPIDA